jgi:hypothetical protein
MAVSSSQGTSVMASEALRDPILENTVWSVALANSAETPDVALGVFLR